MSQPRVGIEVGHKALQFSDIDMGSLFCKHTISFALALVAADTAADSRQIAAVVDYAHGVAEIALGELGYPIGYVVAYRTPFSAGWHLTVEAALGLLHSFG